MIKIQLAPAEELENKYWYIPDLLICASLTGAGYFGVDLHLKNLQEKISSYKEEKDKIEKNTERLSHDLSRYEIMNQKIKDLENKILSLKSITVSQVEKFKPVIIMELLQSLKPDGVWFETVTDHTEESYLTLRAGAFDHVLVSEFMSNLQSTKFQDYDESNVRSLIYFSQLDLEKTALNSAQSDNQGDSGSSQNASNEKINKAFQEAGDDFSNKSEKDGGAASAEVSAPGTEGFPRFEIRIRYEEKKPQTIEKAGT
jgi:hypothetical protein